MMQMPVRVIITFSLLSSVALAGNWPGWRGTEGNGHASGEKNVPLKWDRDTNVRWKVPLPMSGNSSPVVWGNRIFLTQSLDKKGHRRALLCLDRSNGKKLWQKAVTYEPVEPTHNTNPYASATPVTDGERVIVSFGSAGMYCYDFDGNEKWHYDLGKLYHIWGNASSPILYKDLCILWAGPGERQFLLAVNKKTGKKVWQHDEPGGKFGKSSKDWLGSWSTPVVIHVRGHDELILSVPYKVKGFKPDTGKELWHCDGLGPLVYTSPVVSKNGIVVAMSGYGGAALAVKAGGRGDVTKTHRLWHHKKRNPQRIGSSVIQGDYIYMLSEPGLAQCFELKTGKEIWGSKRLGEHNWSSMVLIGERLYVINVAGTTYILKASPKLEVLETNRLNELVRASIAVSNGELFIRSYKHLWCIGKK